MTALVDSPRTRIGVGVPEWPPQRPGRLGARARGVAGYLALLAAIAALTLVRDHWVAGVALVALLFTVPGLLLLRALRVPGESVVLFPAYAPCASLVVLLAAGLGVDLLGPRLGADVPLRTAPLLVGVEGLCVALLLVGVAISERGAVPWRLLDLRVRRAWPLLLPAAAAAGTLRLTNGHGPGLTIAAVAAGGAVLLACIPFAGRLSRSQLSFVLYGAGLAAALSFSLRSQFVYGWDISAEYHILESTYRTGIWHTNHSNDAYGAMLSLTVLPSMLHALAGAPVLTTLKLIYPLLLALLPVAVFHMASRVLSRRWAYVAGVFVAVQSYFFQQQPAIARQELGLVLFVVLVGAVFDRSMPRRAQLPLVALLAAGLAVSHYSTTYLAVSLFIAAVLLQLLVSFVREVPRISAATAVAAVALTAAGAAWYAPVTHSTANLTKFSSNLREHGLDLLPNAKPGQSAIQAYLSGNSPEHIPARQYEKLATADYAQHRKFIHPLPSSTTARYPIADSTVGGDAVRFPLGNRVLSDLDLLFTQLANLAAAVGALAIVFSKRASPTLRRIGLLGLATLVVLALMRLSGTAAQAYNPERAFLQTMVPLSVGIGWLLQRGAGDGVLRRVAAATLAVVGLGSIYMTTVGLRGVAVGGGTPANLTNRGEDYERFYISPPELSSASWMIAAAKPKDLIYADRYGQLRIVAATGRATNIFLDVTPPTLDKTAWIYASRTNVVTGRARGQEGVQYSVYGWPRQFLEQNFATVYTNGTSEVFH